ncbi:putative DNA-binding protein (MmcQ/YjbR family) [Microbacterium endophyticum]|uniref:Putative DNA-binding protein (MmcQ/YjbR family) n=1 Tax=Microbacterium endophyticum TaxID=1526412 RepID=A0A7W4V1Q1_9MICO|nr:MmcQ/YjbR family DNA-binding protein [Microbacterium endophyticum]MBB2975210.1 putative DNA-binding protein (MmcQ/YjbR family) [Microbacterium endophyticum]NIK37578.1 putative DNA-binding protein (MmcQ/YjbR family) [Microbacterium endophyticum]
MESIRDRAREVCLELPQAVEEYPFGVETAVFKVRGKMFAAIRMNQSPTAITLKAAPPHCEALVREYAEITPGYHMNKRHWVTVQLIDSVPALLVEDLIANFYDRVLDTLPRTKEAPQQPDAF